MWGQHLLQQVGVTAIPDQLACALSSRRQCLLYLGRAEWKRGHGEDRGRRVFSMEGLNEVAWGVECLCLVRERRTEG